MLQETLSAGEKIALAQGKDINTEEQFAVCFLVARRETSRLRKIGMSDNWAAECGMKPETYRRAVNKFGILLNDQQDDETVTSSEHLYAKVINAFNKFSDMPTDRLIEIAQMSFTPEAKEMGLKYQMEAETRLAKYAEKTKANVHLSSLNITSFVHSYTQAFLKLGRPGVQARREAMKKAAAHFDKKFTEIQKICK